MLMRFLIAAVVLTAVQAIALAAPQTGMFEGETNYRRPERLAFVVGISEYEENFRRLPNVPNDVKAVSDLLKSIGVALPRVLVSTPEKGFVSRKEFFAQLREFEKDARRSREERGVAPVLIFYFAGHGFTNNESSYLVPSDAFIVAPEDPERLAIRLSDVVGTLQNLEPVLTIAVVDACRDLAFSKLTSPSGESFEIKRGVVAAKSTPSKVRGREEESSLLLYFSTEAAETAADGGLAGNGPFVLSIKEAIEKAIAESAGPELGYRFFSDIAEQVNLLMMLRTKDDGRSPQIPELFNRASAKLPILTTSDHFNHEKRLWDLIDMIVADRLENLQKQLPPKTDPAYRMKFKELEHELEQEKACQYAAFIEKFGFSYFWRDAYAAIKKVIVPNRCVRQQTADPTASFKKAANTHSGDWELSRSWKGTLPPASPATLGPAELKESKLVLAQAKLAPRQPIVLPNEALVALSDTTFTQTAFPTGPRKLTLKAGTVVQFVRFDGANAENAYVRHDQHGYGTIPLADLAAATGRFRATFELERGKDQLSEEQRDLLGGQINEALQVARLSSVVIRHVEGSLQGYAVALDITRTMVRQAGAELRYVPTIESFESKDPGTVEVTASLDFCQNRNPCPIDSKLAAENRFIVARKLSPFRAPLETLPEPSLIGRVP